MPLYTKYAQDDEPPIPPNNVTNVCLSQGLHVRIPLFNHVCIGD